MKPSTSLTLQNIATITIGALLTVTPQVVAILPQQYRDLGTAFVAAFVAAWHLYQPSPSQSQAPSPFPFPQKSGRGADEEREEKH